MPGCTNCSWQWAVAASELHNFQLEHAESIGRHTLLKAFSEMKAAEKSGHGFLKSKEKYDALFPPTFHARMKQLEQRVKTAKKAEERCVHG